jgi:phage terminase large subunit-like protein
VLSHPKTGKQCRNVMVLMPPGAAKSSYVSVCFPPWFLQRKPPGARILACSHSADLIESFSRECRNAVENQSKILGYSLAQDSKAVQEWSTTHNSTYRCSGVGAGLAGRRADLGYIDDYLGSQEDADSKLVREKQWAWYCNDFWPRLKPTAAQVIVANRRHEDDLVGRLLEKEEDNWIVIKLPFFARENDVLGRTCINKDCLSHLDLSTAQIDTLVQDPKVQPYLDSRLWPDYFTREMAAKVLLMPARTQSGLYGQEPAPEEGNYFKKDWLVGYTREEYNQLMESNPRIYGAGDWAVSEEKDANRTCFGAVAMDQSGLIYILPDLFWKVAGPLEVVTAFVAFMKRRQPQIVWSEKGHISKSWGPFLKEMMLNEEVYGYIQEVTPARAKDVRARSIQGRMSMLRVRFPKFTSWWEDAEHELLNFPGGKTDDFADFLAHVGMGLGSMVRGYGPKKEVSEDYLNQPWKPTMKWLKEAGLKQTISKYEGR